MKKIIITVSIPVLLAAVLFTCSKSQAPTDASTATPSGDEAAVAVRVTEVTEGEFSMPVISSGLITTGTESRLSFKTGGIVTSILVEEGESVTKGQLLATLDQTEIDAQASQSKNNLDKTRRDLERIERLYKDSAATLEQYQNVKTAYDVANESWRIASFNKQYSTIHANASGKVIRKFVNEGELVGGGSPVLMINSAAENDWIVRVGLPDVDWVRINKGDKAIVKTDAYSGESFDAVVSLINEAADPVSGLYMAEVKISPRGRKLATGLVATVEVIPSQKQKLKSIPIEAIIEGSGSHAFVFVADAEMKSVKKIPVQVAYVSNDKAIISGGLENISKVITAGSAFLTESSTIKVVEL
ncbi:MAG TPA: efflux RND transporter periplasmic adaptor subunit [Cyclobacteriaceae bacterium]|nr:efflux RND transporter periplasmic adaptor subunit [Cyclobacteriaceae bacterium]